MLLHLPSSSELRTVLVICTIAPIPFGTCNVDPIKVWGETAKAPQVVIKSQANLPCRHAETPSTSHSVLEGQKASNAVGARQVVLSHNEGPGGTAGHWDEKLSQLTHSWKRFEQAWGPEIVKHFSNRYRTLLAYVDELAQATTKQREGALAQAEVHEGLLNEGRSDLSDKSGTLMKLLHGLTSLLVSSDDAELPDSFKVQLPSLILTTLDLVVQLEPFNQPGRIFSIMFERHAKTMTLLLPYLQSLTPLPFISYKSLESEVWWSKNTQHLQNLFATLEQKQRASLIHELLLSTFQEMEGAYNQDKLAQKLMSQVQSPSLLQELHKDSSTTLTLLVTELIQALKDEGPASEPYFLDEYSPSMFAYHMLSFILRYSNENFKKELEATHLTPETLSKLKLRELLLDQLAASSFFHSQYSKTVLRVSKGRDRDIENLNKTLLSHLKSLSWIYTLQDNLESEWTQLAFESFSEYRDWFKREGNLKELGKHHSTEVSKLKNPVHVQFAEKWQICKESFNKHLEIQGKNKIGITERIKKTLKGIKAIWNKKEFPRTALEMVTSDEETNLSQARCYIDIMEWRFNSILFGSPGLEKDAEWRVLMKAPKLHLLDLEMRKVMTELEEYLEEETEVSLVEKKNILAGRTNQNLLDRFNLHLHALGIPKQTIIS